MAANAVARVDNLEFLTDVVPRTQTYKAYKEKKLKDGEAMSKGQRQLDYGAPAQDSTSNGDVIVPTHEGTDGMEIDGAEEGGQMAAQGNEVVNGDAMDTEGEQV